MDTYVMKKDLFIELIHKARKTSSVYTLLDIVNASCDELDIRGVSHKGYFAAISDFKSFMIQTFLWQILKLLRICLIQTGQSTQEQMIPARHSILKQEMLKILLYQTDVWLKALWNILL